MIRYETQVPPTSPEEGLCSASIRSEQGYVMVLNGLTGNAPRNAVFSSPDTTLDLSSASRVLFGNGESLQVEAGRQMYLISTKPGGSGASGGSDDPGARRELLEQLQLERQAATPRTVDWRILP